MPILEEIRVSHHPDNCFMEKFLDLPTKVSGDDDLFKSAQMGKFCGVPVVVSPMLPNHTALLIMDDNSGKLLVYKKEDEKICQINIPGLAPTIFESDN